jgi:hypothetical protein
VLDQIHGNNDIVFLRSGLFEPLFDEHLMNLYLLGREKRGVGLWLHQGYARVGTGLKQLPDEKALSSPNFKDRWIRRKISEA